MDEMIIRSGFVQSLLEKIIEKAVKQKFGCNLSLMFQEPIRLSFDGERVNLVLNLNAEIQKEDLKNLLKDYI